MNRNTSNETPDGSLLDLTSESVPLLAPIGSAIVSHRGTVWITQEGLYDDVILQPGERFVVRSRALILMSATSGRAKVLLASSPDVAASVDGDVFELLRVRARRLRTEAVHDIAQATSERAARLISKAAAAIHRAFEPVRRVTEL